LITPKHHHYEPIFKKLPTTAIPTRRLVREPAASAEFPWQARFPRNDKRGWHASVNFLNAVCMHACMGFANCRGRRGNRFADLYCVNFRMPAIMQASVRVLSQTTKVFPNGFFFIILLFTHLLTDLTDSIGYLCLRRCGLVLFPGIAPLDYVAVVSPPFPQRCHRRRPDLIVTACCLLLFPRACRSTMYK